MSLRKGRRSNRSFTLHVSSLQSTIYMGTCCWDYRVFHLVWMDVTNCLAVCVCRRVLAAFYRGVGCALLAFVELSGHCDVIAN